MRFKQIATYRSHINGKIEVRLTDDGEYHLLVDEMVQSGPIIEAIFYTACQKLLPHTFRPKHIIMLGYGGGSAVRVLQKLYHPCIITGVEIDPVMFQLGQKYFPHSNHQHHNLINQDIFSFSAHLAPLAPHRHQTLALIDCSIGAQVPAKIADPSFLKPLLKHAQYVILNLPTISRALPQTKKTKKSIQSHFSVKTITYSNNLIMRITPP